MRDLNRRAVIGLAGGAAAWPLAARAQPADQVRRIGWLLVLTRDHPEAQARFAAFRAGLLRRDGSRGATCESKIAGAAAIPGDCAPPRPSS